MHGMAVHQLTASFQGDKVLVPLFIFIPIMKASELQQALVIPCLTAFLTVALSLARNFHVGKKYCLH